MGTFVPDLRDARPIAPFPTTYGTLSVVNATLSSCLLVHSHDGVASWHWVGARRWVCARLCAFLGSARFGRSTTFPSPAFPAAASAASSPPPMPVAPPSPASLPNAARFASVILRAGVSLASAWPATNASAPSSTAFFDSNQFEDLAIPTAIVATDLGTGDPVVFKQGSLADAIRASCAFPGLFEPVMIGTRCLADGSLGGTGAHASRARTRRRNGRRRLRWIATTATTALPPTSFK